MNRHLNLALKAVPHSRFIVLADLVRSYAPLNGAVLDIGCGRGELLGRVHAIRPDLRLAAADADPECVKRANAVVGLDEDYVLPPDGSQFDMCGHGHDVVVMSHVLEHLLDPVKAVESVLRLAKDGGFVILAVPNPVTPKIIAKALLRRHYVNRGHVMCWDRSHWMNFLEVILRLDVVEYASDGLELLPYSLEMRFAQVRSLELHVGRRVPWLTESTIAVVRTHGRESRGYI